MSRLTGWFRSGGASDSTSDPKAMADRLEQQKRDLEQAMAWAELIMNDDIDGASKKLDQGTSVFHEFGAVVTIFLRSVLGFEKSVMTETTNRLGHCETRAWDDYTKAQKLGRAGTSSKVYPPGTEYELVRAETLLMGAVVGVLHESLVEAMKSFYKLRKAFFVLDGIINTENKVLGDSKSSSRISLTTPANEKNEAPKTGADADAEKSDSSDPVFVDAPETASGARTPADPLATATGATNETPEKQLEDLKIADEQLQEATIPAQSTAVDPNLLDNPVDKFIHSGANMCFGIMLLLITLIPPAFSKILSVVGFRGDRTKAIRMLWQAAVFQNINGAMAALMLFVYYNAYLGQVDIVPFDEDYDDDAEIVGPPRAKCNALLVEMRRRYPDSSLWRVEEARSHARDRDVPKAIEILKEAKEAKMKQVQAMALFELSIDALLVQDWSLMRSSFLRCLEVNDWSPTMYYYMAGTASLELYRDAMQRGDEAEARVEKTKATDYLRKAPTLVGKKRIMTRQLPLETFIQRKMAKWEARAKTLGADLADVIGSSPALEMAYMWNGQNRMGEKELKKAEATLGWERCTGSEEVVNAVRTEREETGLWALGMATVLKGLGRLEEARALLHEHLIKVDRAHFKGITDDYILPTAIYEEAVLAWLECCKPPAELSAEETAAYRRRKLEECEALLEQVRGWESYSMDARIGMRVQSGFETLAWFRTKMGWKKA
ncbi:mitochondrial outer membrane protein IML2 [Sarocladium implicatum]|nr:mitochondrial outer membrane protein IML2 [Sarocladium implicatum]